MRHPTLAACALLAFTPALIAAPPSVRVITFGDLGNPRIDWASINNRGDIAIDYQGGAVHTLWADGTLERMTVPDALFLSLVDISDSGHVLVRSEFPQTPQGIPRMLHYAQRGVPGALAIDPMGGHVEQVGRVNATGGTIATAEIPGVTERFFFLSPDREHIPIRQIPLNAGAYGVNDANLIAGGMRNSYGNPNNWLALFDTEGRRLRETWAGAGDWWRIELLNNNGIALGTIIPEDNIGDYDAFFWDTNTGAITRIEPPEGFDGIFATALNDEGWFTAQLAEIDGSRVPYVWTPETGFFDLSSLIRPGDMLSFTEVLDINNRGEVLIEGSAFADGEWNDALFVVTIPAPGSALPLAVSGMLALGRRRTG